jgi:hypothetical protein
MGPGGAAARGATSREVNPSRCRSGGRTTKTSSGKSWASAGPRAACSIFPVGIKATERLRQGCSGKNHFVAPRHSFPEPLGEGRPLGGELHFPTQIPYRQGHENEFLVWHSPGPQPIYASDVIDRAGSAVEVGVPQEFEKR